MGRNDGPRQPPFRPSANGASPAAILYTSGSTGLPKGILISHANLLAGARIVSAYLQTADDERIISIPPFSFDYGLNQLLSAVRCGATLVLQRSPLPADICRTLVANEITAMAAVPPLWIQLLQRTSPFSRMSFPHLRYITNTGGKLPADAVRQLRRLLPHVRVYLMYGLSEAFRSTYLSPDEVDKRPDSIGKAIPESEILIVSSDGRQCQPGEVGELVHCGPTVALGYWNDAEATSKVFRHHPFDPSRASERVVYSGDLIKSDEEGFLYYVGRRDQLIKSHGYRISPTEVEEIVFETGCVKEVVARGEPDPVAGEVVVVHCVPRDPGTFSTQVVLDHCRREMPRYMVPRRIHVHESFPRTASGKIDRQSIGHDACA
jgi:acyl-CoA synthetase (AMP-forming)/AMP-acid ligase II